MYYNSVCILRDDMLVLLVSSTHICVFDVAYMFMLGSKDQSQNLTV